MVKYFKTASTYIDSDLHKEFKEKCRVKNVSMHEALRNFILDYVKDSEEKKIERGKEGEREDSGKNGEDGSNAEDID